jgi:4,5-DOPA dioxygenase extradiol
MQWNNNAFDWAIEFDTWSKQRIEAGDHQALINYQAKGKIADLSIPTNEHYLPLLYAVALQDKTDNLRFFNEKTMMGSISMRSLILSSH